MRITKQLSETLAKQLLEKKAEALKQKKNELADLVGSLVEETLPAAVMAFFRNYGEFTKTTDYVRLQADERALDYHYFFIKSILPNMSDNYWVKITTEEYDKVQKMKTLIETLEAQYSKSRSEVANALFGLRTYSNVVKEFPEAAALLPKPQSTALAVDIKKIRALVQ